MTESIDQPLDGSIFFTTLLDEGDEPHFRDIYGHIILFGPKLVLLQRTQVTFL
jgi:hypothetical protein